MCSARVRRCRAQCDVLFIPQLVTILPHIFFVAFLCFFFFLLLLLLSSSSSSSSSLLSSSSSSSLLQFFLSLVVADNRQIGCVSTFLWHVNTDVLCAAETQNHGIYLAFFASGSKHHGSYSVFWPVPSKNIGIYAVFTMLQEVLFPCQRHKNTVFWLLARTEKTAKSAQHGLQKASCNFIIFFWPQNGKTQRNWRILG